METELKFQKYKKLKADVIVLSYQYVLEHKDSDGIDWYECVKYIASKTGYKDNEIAGFLINSFAVGAYMEVKQRLEKLKQSV